MKKRSDHQDLSDRAQRAAKSKPIIINALRNAFPGNKDVVDALEIAYDTLAKKSSFKLDDNTRELGLRFLEEAARDVGSCKSLYSKKIYSHSVYHLQQAVEKTVKGYVLLEGFFKSTELYEIKTHFSLLVMMKATFDKTGITQITKGSQDQGLNNKMADAIKTINNEEKRIELAKTSRVGIQSLIFQIGLYRNIGLHIQKTLIEGLSGTGIEISESGFQSVFAMSTLLILATITFPHEAYTRYPDPNGRLSPTDYNMQLGVVRETRCMTRIIENEIKSLNKIYSRPI